VTLKAIRPPSLRCTSSLAGRSDSHPKAPGLGTRQSDASSVNTWNWQVPTDTKLGTGQRDGDVRDTEGNQDHQDRVISAPR
jgi:hypothetical protein